MKRLRLFCLTLAVLLLPAKGFAVDIWHSNSGWVQGVCSYQFTFDGQDVQSKTLTGMTHLLLGVQALDARKQALGQSVIEVGAFADSSATRYTVAYWEGDCEARAFVIEWAFGVVDGKIHDLLSEKNLSVKESPLKESVGLVIGR